MFLHHLNLRWSRLSVHQDNDRSIWSIAEHYAKTIIHGRYETQAVQGTQKYKEKEEEWMDVGHKCKLIQSVDPGRRHTL